MKNSILCLIFSLSMFCASCTPKPGSSSTIGGVQVSEVDAAQARINQAPSFDNYISLGLSHTRAGKHEDALKAYQTAATINPRAPVAYNNICSEYTALRKWELGIENCQKALKLEPTFSLASNNLAYLLKSRDAQLARIAAMAANIKAGGKDSDRSRLDLGMEHYTLGEYETAIEIWRHVPESSVFFATVQNNLASTYILNKKYDLAKIHIDKALAIEPKNVLFHNNERWLQSAQKESGKP